MPSRVFIIRSCDQRTMGFMTNDATQYTWTAFYSEFADRLLDFKEDRQALISAVQSVFRDIGIKLPKLEVDGVPTDIDPFTVIGLFNKGITRANRKKIVAELASKLRIVAPEPDDFLGVPLLNNLNATFYAFSDNPKRGAGDIDRLWDVFKTALAYSDDPNATSRAAFSAAYDSVLHQPGLKWKITQGLFWVRPFTFLNLDSRNRWFLEQPGTMSTNVVQTLKPLKEAPESSVYLSLCNEVREELRSGKYEYQNFPELSAKAWKVSTEVNEQKKAKEKAAQEQALGDADVDTVSYWLYAPGTDASQWDAFYSRGIMAIGWPKLGDLSLFENKEDIRLRLQEIYGDESSYKNSAHATWQFSREIKPGDVVFAKRGSTEIVGRGVVKGDYSFDSGAGEYPHIRDVEWKERGAWHTRDQLVRKTLTEITDYPDLISELESLVGTAEEQIDEVEERQVEYPEYSKEDFLDEVYMDDDAYDTLTGVLVSKKNLILQGAPGVGKTFIAKRLAYSNMGLKDVSRVQMVQFHQIYSYEDFIEGYRPSGAGFELEKGAFYTFCKRAQDDEENDYFFVIDEINRGNISRIFGELLMLIESDKRGPNNKLQLLYSGEKFYVPRNVYIIGMMNTADRSLAMLDYAMRRRFAFFDLKPAFDSAGFKAYRRGLNNEKFDALVRTVERLNIDISEDDSLGDGFCIGHSYFTGMEPNDVAEAKLAAIVNYEIVPMLKEYWFDDSQKAREWADRLRDSIR